MATCLIYFQNQVHNLRLQFSRPLPGKGGRQQGGQVGNAKHEAVLVETEKFFYLFSEIAHFVSFPCLQRVKSPRLRLNTVEGRKDGKVKTGQDELCKLGRKRFPKK